MTIDNFMNHFKVAKIVFFCLFLLTFQYFFVTKKKAEKFYKNYL